MKTILIILLLLNSFLVIGKSIREEVSLALRPKTELHYTDCLKYYRKQKNNKRKQLRIIGMIGTILSPIITLAAIDNINTPNDSNVSVSNYNTNQKTVFLAGAISLMGFSILWMENKK